MMASTTKSFTSKRPSVPTQLLKRNVWEEKQDDGEDIESLLEGLPMPRPSVTSLSDNFDIIQDNKTELVTVTSSQRAIESYEQLLSAFNETIQKCEKLVVDANNNSIRLLALEQKQNKIAGQIAEQHRHFQQLEDRMQTGAEVVSDTLQRAAIQERLLSRGETVDRGTEDSASLVMHSETAPTCSLLEFYPRPGNGYSGRIHHTISNQTASFKGLNFEQILPFIKKHLPQSLEIDTGDQPISQASALEPAEQATVVIEEQPTSAPKVQCSFIKEIGLIQERQKITQRPYHLQARKRFAIVLSLELPNAQQDAIKTNYIVRYDVEIKARHLRDNSIACQSLQHGGMNSKLPKDTRAFQLEALAPGNYMLDIRVVVLQKNISEQWQREINVA